MILNHAAKDVLAKYLPLTVKSNRNPASIRVLITSMTAALATEDETITQQRADDWRAVRVRRRLQSMDKLNRDCNPVLGGINGNLFYGPFRDGQVVLNQFGDHHLDHLTDVL